jgi:4a-hydroxytetrahydrobiopterin dehydratase
MTEALVEKTCTPCRGGIPPLTRAEAEELLPQAPEWALMDNAHRIEKTFRFGNFREALAFVQKVGELAEAEGHHPDISFGAGAMRLCRCAPRRSRVSTRTISSWR